MALRLWARLLGVLMVVSLMPLAATALAQSQAEGARGDRFSGAPWASRSPAGGMNGAAATSHPLATLTAIEVLKAGGTAADAAIAANAMLGFVEPTGCGIGGDLFVIVWDPKTKRLHGLNASGRAPLGQSLDQLKAHLPKGAKEPPNWGSRSVTVPGAVDGWFELHGRFGKLPMRQLLQPAIDAAKAGAPVPQLIGAYYEGAARSFERLRAAGDIEEIENYKRAFWRNGRPPKEGAIFANPDLAASYELIAAGGRDAFYKGALARAMDAYMKRIGGPLRLADFAAHKSDWVETISTTYRGFEVHELPPNGQGLAALQMLNILEGYDLKAMGWGSADLLHVIAEAKKLAFADRARFYADPAFAPAPLKGLLSKAYAAERRKLISMARAMPSVSEGKPGADTIYLTVADKDGMMVSLIQSNYRGMGSGLVPDGPDGRTAGFMLQDRGAQFSLDPSHPNVYAPGKRPFHTIIPAFVLKDGAPYFSFGVMGGAMQPQGHVQVLVNLIDFGMNVQEAGDAARIHHDGSTDATGHPPMTDGGVLEVERGFKPEVLEELRRRGHTVTSPGQVFGGYQGILRDPVTGAYWAASEFRKDGLALAY